MEASSSNAAPSERDERVMMIGGVQVKFPCKPYPSQTQMMFKVNVCPECILWAHRTIFYRIPYTYFSFMCSLSELRDKTCIAFLYSRASWTEDANSNLVTLR